MIRRKSRSAPRGRAAILLGAILAAPAAAQAPTIPNKAPAYADPCDRGCLTTAADQFVQGLLANDGQRVPLAPEFRYTENGQTLAVGDGLWGTLSAYAGLDPRVAPAAAPLAYRVAAVDPANGAVALAVQTDENGTKGVLILRLKVAAGRIREAEALIVREEFGGDRGGTISLYQPRLLTTMDGELVKAADPLFVDAGEPMPAERMIAAANAYLDAVDAGSARTVPIAADCLRRDNGSATTGVADAKPLDPGMPGFRPFSLGCAAQIDSGYFGYVDGIRERHFVADAERGILVAYSDVDTPGTVTAIRRGRTLVAAYPGNRAPVDTKAQYQPATAEMAAPTTQQTATLFRFVGGKIARIDNFARGAPFGARSGWGAPR